VVSSGLRFGLGAYSMFGHVGWLDWRDEAGKTKVCSEKHSSTVG